MAKRRHTSTAAYIDSLALTNFRGFRSTGRLPLRPLTFIVGPNSSGKSALASAIQLIIQSRLFAVNPVGYAVEWIGPLADLGSFEDVVYKHDTGRSITIELGYSGLQDHFNGERSYSGIVQRFTIKQGNGGSTDGAISKLSVIERQSGVQVHFRISMVSRRVNSISMNGETLRLVSESGADGSRFVDSRLITSALRHLFVNALRKDATRRSSIIRLREFILGASLFRLFESCQRVSSAREGPRRWYARAQRDVANAEFGPAVLDRATPEVLALSSGSRKDRRTNAREIIERGLTRLGVSDRINVRRLSRYHSSIEVRDAITKVPCNLVDVGFGVAQSIPILNAIGSTRPGILFVEQPEIHLHIKAQAELAMLLCTASNHRQVIVETHSDHMINKARIMVAEGKLSADGVQVLYVDRNASGSTVEKIEVTETGDFSKPWPAGFFDERFHDTLRLNHLRSKAGGAGK